MLTLAGVASTAGPTALTATAATVPLSSIVGLRLGDRGPGVDHRPAAPDEPGLRPTRRRRVRPADRSRSAQLPGEQRAEPDRRRDREHRPVPRTRCRCAVRAHRNHDPTTSTSAPATGSPAATAIVGLKLGDHGAQCDSCRPALLGQGFVLSNGADGGFGRSTEHAVALVQRFNQLPQTGVVSNATAARPRPRRRRAGDVDHHDDDPGSVSPIRRAHRRRERRPRARSPAALAANGITVRGGADGLFGPATMPRCVAYERAHGLGDTGVVDASTARLLRLGGTAATPSTPATGGFAALGERGQRVVALQRSLIAAGVVGAGGADGVFGPATADRGRRVPATPTG